MNSKQKNKIRKAQKLGITIEELPYDSVEEFYSLTTELKNRVGLSNKPKEIYAKVLDIYSKKEKGVCLAAKFQEKFISTMLLFANGNFTIAWVNGRKGKLPNNLYQNELLLWECIVWAKNHGSRYLDFCGLDEDNLPHLARQKLSFAKEIVPFYSFSKRSLMYKIINAVQSKVLDTK